MPRLSSEERRHHIVVSTLPVFADKGFEGTRARDLSEAAGVTDALIFKYFPTKRHLFDAVMAYCLDGAEAVDAHLATVPPGVPQIVATVDAFLGEVLSNHRSAEVESVHKLTLKSLGTDGTFAREYFTRKMSLLSPTLALAWERARTDGDLIPGAPDFNADLAWIVHHLLMALSYFNFSQPRLELYSTFRSEVRLLALRFCLLGLGVRPEVVQRYMISFKGA